LKQAGEPKCWWVRDFVLDLIGSPKMGAISKRNSGSAFSKQESLRPIWMGIAAGLTIGGKSHFTGRSPISPQQSL